MPRHLLWCMEGLEADVAADAAALGARVVATFPGRVVVEAPPDFRIAANLAHPTAWGVHEVVAEARVATLADAEALAYAQSWEDLFDASRSWAAAAVRTGDHAFTSVDLARHVGEGVGHRFEDAHGRYPPVDLRAPEVRVVLHLHDHQAFLTLDTTGPTPLSKRAWRVGQHPAALDACLASALVRRSGWTPEDGALLDPLCGSGTIPIEAWHRARGRPVNHARADFAYRRLRAHDAAGDAEARADIVAREDARAADVRGNERHAPRLEAARANAAAAGVDDIAWSLKDFVHLPRPARLGAVVTNPPWGHRMTSRRVSERIQRQLREQMRAWAAAGSYRAVLLLGEHRVAGTSWARETDVTYGGITCRIVEHEW